MAGATPSPFKRYTRPTQRALLPSLHTPYIGFARNLFISVSLGAALTTAPTLKTWALGLSTIAVIAADRSRHRTLRDAGLHTYHVVIHDLTIHSLDIAAFYAVRHSLYLAPLSISWVAIHTLGVWERDRPTDFALFRLLHTIDPDFLD